MAKVKRRTWKNKDGSQGQNWVLDYTDITGKRVMKGGFKTKADAQKALNKVLIAKDSGSSCIIDEKLTFERAAIEYIELHANIYCKSSTIKGYNSYLKNHLLPYFGKIKLVNITPKSINEYISFQLKGHLSRNSINKHLILLGGIFSKQVNEGIIIHNPVRKVKKLKIIHKEMSFLNKNDVKEFLKIAEVTYPDFYPLLLTAITTGMRRGELLGLTWDCINWQSKRIRVHKSLYRNKLIDPKSHNSIRNIDMPDKLISTLRQWQQICPEGEKNLVFPNSVGEFLDADNMIKRRFLPCLKLAGINAIRFHDLRHTYTSILIAENVPLKYIQSHLGHSSIQVTMDRYGHLLPEVYQKGIEAFDKFI